MNATENDKADILYDVCKALTNKRDDHAAAILNERYPFVPFVNVGRRYSISQMLGVFIRDGFIDRYSGNRLVCPATLRLISKRLPKQFPFHKNWRTDICHFSFYELTPTVDHIIPISRGGTDDGSNWITTSMTRNAAKSCFTIEEIGWRLHPPGDIRKWDGLLGWFLDQARADSSILANNYLRQWFRAAMKKNTKE